MKKITITFTQAGREIGSAIGEFESLPGPGRLTWTGKDEIERHLSAPYKAPLPIDHYAETFQDAMLGIAGHHKWEALVTTTGEWTEYSQDDIIGEMRP